MFKTEAVVVGAGVIGLSIARALATRGLEVLVLEREAGIGEGISSRNSEVIHAGLYYPPESLKARLCVVGRRALSQYCADRNVPHRRCGKLVVATTPEEDAALVAVKERAEANGVEDIALIGAARLNELEPHVRGTSALLSNTTGIVDGHALMLGLQGDAETAGATVQLQTPFAEADFGSSSVTLRTGGVEPAEIEAGLLRQCRGT
jgi:L-2-hydroxyglutarate oxidase LhgO